MFDKEYYRSYYKRIGRPKDEQFAKDHGISRSGYKWRKLKQGLAGQREVSRQETDDWIEQWRNGQM